MKNSKVRQMFADCCIGTDHLQVGADGTIVNDHNWPTINGRTVALTAIAEWGDWMRRYHRSLLQANEYFPHDLNSTEETYVEVRCGIDAFDIMMVCRNVCKARVERKGVMEVFVGNAYELHMLKAILKHFFKLDVEGPLTTKASEDVAVRILGEGSARLYNTLSRNGWEIKVGVYGMSDVLTLSTKLSCLAPVRKVDILKLQDGRQYLDVPNEVINMLKSSPL